MTETTHTPLPCPCCRSAEIENERPDSPVYCRKCWLRAVDLERWNTRAGSHHRLVETAQALIDHIGPQNSRVYRSDPPVQNLLAALKEAGR